MHSFEATATFVTIMPFSSYMPLILNPKVPVYKPCLEDIVENLSDLPSSNNPRSYYQNGDFCLGCEEPVAGTKREMLLQYA
jgi:hypothetical protein